jgi:pimeloyl-ACP methyl ester carboxylesterase
MHAVVLVSGGAAVTPYTTPDATAGTGLAAGNTLTALRAHLLARGHQVFTAPARIGVGVVAEDSGWQGFGEVARVLPAEVTVNAVGTIDDAGASLARFLRWLADEHGVTEIDLVGHSMGGLFSRAAIRELASAGGPSVTRLVTLGTPWTGGLLGDVTAGDLTLADAAGDPSTEHILTQSLDYAHAVSEGAAEEVSERFLAGDTGWNARQRGVLDGIPVTLVAGRYFAAATEPSLLWPHDGLVSLRSARADLVGADVLPTRESHEFDDVHSIFFADAFGLDWTRALTWDPEVFAVVEAALA